MKGRKVRMRVILPHNPRAQHHRWKVVMETHRTMMTTTRKRMRKRERKRKQFL